MRIANEELRFRDGDQSQDHDQGSNKKVSDIITRGGWTTIALRVSHAWEGNNLELSVYGGATYIPFSNDIISGGYFGLGFDINFRNSFLGLYLEPSLRIHEPIPKPIQSFVFQSSPTIGISFALGIGLSFRP